MPALIPVGGTEIDQNQQPEGVMDAIKSVLAERGEKRAIAVLWWHEGQQGYFVLIDTPQGEPSATHFMSTQTVAKKRKP